MKSSLSLFFILISLCAQARERTDSMFKYQLFPGHAKLKPGGILTLQLLKYDERMEIYFLDTDNPVMVSSWLINGSIGVQASQTISGRLEGIPNNCTIKYHAPESVPTTNPVRISCEFMQGGEKIILFADVQIVNFSNGFCIDPLGIGIEGLRRESCVLIDRLDFKKTREEMVQTLDKASQYKNLTPAQQKKIEALKNNQKKGEQAAASTDWATNGSTGMAVYNSRCHTLYISITEPLSNKNITVVVPSLREGVFVTAIDKCMLYCSGNGKAYVSQYCQKDANGNCEPKLIQAMIRIDSIGKAGEAVTGFFTGKTGLVVYNSATPEIHTIYGSFSVIRQPDIQADCNK